MKTVHIKAIQRRHTHLWHICIPMHRVIEEIMYISLNWPIGVACDMTPDISDFIPGLFLETDKYIEVVDWNFITVKKPGQVQK